MPIKDYSGKSLCFEWEIFLTWLCLGITLLATFFFLRDLSMLWVKAWENSQWKALSLQILFAGVMVGLVYGNIVYQLTRQGYVCRLLAFRSPQSPEVDALYTSKSTPSVSVLIPSFKEEMKVIEQALYSSALLRYPEKSVVLLIDDPYKPANRADQEALEEALGLPGRIQRELDSMRKTCEKAYDQFLARTYKAFDIEQEVRILSARYNDVARWFMGKADAYACGDHTDRLFIEEVFLKPLDGYTQEAQRWLNRAWNASLYQEMQTAYQKMTAVFRANLTSFERKRYENLSNESNKAMNLNSYIGLMGGNYIEVMKDDHCKIYLEPISQEAAEYTFKKPDYIITLDADSILSHDYAERLVHFMEQPQNLSVGVVQTPYSAVPGCEKEIERIAGATTDMQFIIHQGFTHYWSTYWVGANALLRVRALEDIREDDVERGFPIRRFISNKTVIEDTESSIDMILKGWRLHNYPRRLSYSATPTDFGSLIIQRERWANGGLIILSKLFKYLCTTPISLRLVKEGLVRLHYLISIAVTNIGVPVLLLVPFQSELLSLWLPLTALPYYWLYTRDLVLTGYNKKDILSVYALNLILIPVNLSGVFRSFYQILTGVRTSFRRTPKIKGRTQTPAKFVVIEYGMLAYCLFILTFDVLSNRWAHGIFALVNGALLWYAICKFILVKESAEDVFYNIKRKPFRRTPSEN